MLTTIAAWLRRSPLLLFFMLAYAFSWSIGVLLIANYHGWIAVPPSIHYLSSFGPAIAAVAVTLLVQGRPGLRDLLARITKWNIGARWLLVACVSPLALASIAVLANFLLSATLPDLGLLGHVEYLGDIGIIAALLLWLATFGFGEEVGWRGFALPIMQQRSWSPLLASLVIGVLWALWHLPAFFYKPALVELGVAGLPGFGIGVVCGSVLLGWLYNRSSGSIVAVAVWHALFDFVTASPLGQGTVAAITSTLVMVWAALIVLQQWRDRRHTRTGAQISVKA